MRSAMSGVYDGNGGGGGVCDVLGLNIACL